MKKYLFILFFIVQNQLIAQNFEWNTIDSGILYSAVKSKNNQSIFLAFGGWTAKAEWTSIWAENLYAVKLKKLKIAHLFAVKGPKNSLYKDREINNRKLAEKILGILKSQKISSKIQIILVAHSSGAYVAHEFLNTLFALDSANGYKNTKDKISYFNLDGGIGIKEYDWTSLQIDYIQHFKAIYGVYAFDSNTGIYSPNKDEMLELQTLGKNCFPLELNASNCGCIKKWCVHETLIITKPHNINTFDLEKDYTDFNSLRTPVFEYFNVLEKK